MVQQMRNQDFERPPNVDSSRGRKQKEQAEPEEQTGGFFHAGLTPELQQSLVNYSRRAVAGARVAGRLARRAHDDEKLARREDRLEKLLTAAVEHYARALELFDAWKAQRASSKQQVEKALTDEPPRAGAKRPPKPEAQQLEYLRLQIEMRVLGCGWTQYATRWSSRADEKIGTVAHLTALVEELMVEEKARARFPDGSEKGLPTEPAPPHHEARNLGQLGTADADATAIAMRSLFSADELRRKAETERQRRVEAGIADGVEMQQPHDAPAFNKELLGKRLEVLWKYHEQLPGGEQRAHLI